MSDNLDGTSAADVGHTPGAKVTEGKYPELRLVKTEFFKSRKSPFGRCFKAQFEVLGDVNGYKAGALIEYFSKLEFNKHESYDKEEQARTKGLLGALFGYGTVAEIDANIRLSQHLVQVSAEGQPMLGSVVAGELVYKGIFSKWTFTPVLENGKPKVVRGHVGGQPATIQAAAAPAAAPAIVPPPPFATAPAARVLPPGWAPHPDAQAAAQGWIYNTQNPQEMKQAV